MTNVFNNRDAAMKKSINYLFLFLFALFLFSSCEKENSKDEFSHLYGINLMNITIPYFNFRIESELIYIYRNGEVKYLFTYEIKDGIIITDTDCKR